MHDEFPVLQAILEGGADEVDTDDVATHLARRLIFVS
jgi:hypothetical protein